MQRATAINERVAVLCVLDGHGKEVGRVAAMAAKSCLFHFLDNNYAELLQADRCIVFPYILVIKII